MKRLRTLSTVFVLLLTLAVLPRFSQAASAQEVTAAQITAFEVIGPDGKTIGDEPLRAGAVYKVNLTVKVAAGINDRAVLKTNLVRPAGADRFWTLKVPYKGIDTNTWQPGLPELRFQAIEGEVNLELQGAVPADYVSTKLANDDVLHKAKSIALVELSLASGKVLETKGHEAIDNSIDAYRKALGTVNDSLKTAKADTKYVELVRSVTRQAQASGDNGYTERAVAILAAIPPAAGWAMPRGSSLFLWIIFAVLGVLALLFGFLTMRYRGETGLVKSQVDEQAKRLELLAAKANRIGDTQLGNDINKVKSELEGLAGR